MQLSLILASFASASAVVANLHAQVNAYNYGDPSTGCMSTEQNVSINGITGDVCSPKCLAGNACPKKLPPGTPAATKGQCVLEVNGSTTPTLCVLICDPATAGSCGSSANTACQAIQGVGVCTWTD